MASIGQGKAAGVPERMWVGFEAKLGGFTGALDKFCKARTGKWAASFRRKNECRSRLLLALELPQSTQFIAHDGVNAIDAALEAPDVQIALAPVDLVPAQVDQLADPQAMPVSDQDHQAVAMTVVVLPSRLHEPLDFVSGQILAGP